MFESLIQRTVIIGNSGAGKSALAESLAASIHVPVIDLDLLNWEGNGYGRKRDEDATRRMTLEVSAQPLWIIEGVYGWLAGDSAPAPYSQAWKRELSRPSYAHDRGRALAWDGRTLCLRIFTCPGPQRRRQCRRWKHARLGPGLSARPRLGRFRSGKRDRRQPRPRARRGGARSTPGDTAARHLDRFPLGQFGNDRRGQRHRRTRRVRRGPRR